MPDWTYQPILKPLLFRLPARKARDLTVSVTGTLGKLPLGTNLLDFMGDMAPHGDLAVETAGLVFSGRVGLAPGMIFDEGAIIAFSHFGFGHIEIGPVTVSPVVPLSVSEAVSQAVSSTVPSSDTPAAPPDESLDFDIARDENADSIVYRNIPENPGLSQVRQNIEMARDRFARNKSVHLGVRITNRPGTALGIARNDLIELARHLSYCADFLTIDSRWWGEGWTASDIEETIVCLNKELKERNNIPLFALVHLDLRDEKIATLLNLVRAGHLEGLVTGGGRLNESKALRTFGRPCKEAALELTRKLARDLPSGKTLIAGGGIIEPKDALDFLDAGATLVQLHSGLVYSGPGLAKRINESIAYRTRIKAAPQIAPHATPLSIPTPRPNDGWIGFLLVATGLIISALAVITVGLVRVLLPYDESYLGVRISEIPSINPNLLKFMCHDRVTLGGTSLSGAVLFFCLALFGVRNRHKWAYRAEVAGITAGFMAFFLYLGFKYFDPLHALVCVLVLPFFIWGIARKPQFVAEESANLENDSAWRRSQLGQLMFVAIGLGLLLAGITIAFVGCSTIFVKEDLLFMNTTRETLACHPHLLPLIAHDRASFGGCLWAVGTVELLTSLYGYREGNRWVFWTLLIGGLPGFIAVLGIHVAIGYTHFIHLLPAYVAVALYAIGLYCSHDYLCKK